MTESVGAAVTVLIAAGQERRRSDVRAAIDADKRFGVCAEVPDAAGAVAAALRERPDLCLLDVRMPGSGLAAAWEIGAQVPGSRVVMLTVSVDDRDVAMALNSGVAGYLLKSMDRQRLTHALWDVYQGTFTIPFEIPFFGWRIPAGPVPSARRRVPPRRRLPPECCR